MNWTVIIIVTLRLLVAGILAAGAVWLAHEGKDGWGWCLFVALLLGCVSVETKRESGG